MNSILKRRKRNVKCHIWELSEIQLLQCSAIPSWSLSAVIKKDSWVWGIFYNPVRSGIKIPCQVKILWFNILNHRSRVLCCEAFFIKNRTVFVQDQSSWEGYDGTGKSFVTYDQFNGSRITCRGEDKRSSVVAGMGYLQKPSVVVK